MDQNKHTEQPKHFNNTHKRGEIQNDWHSHTHTAGVQGDSQSHAHLLSIAIDCDVITHFPPSAALPLALLWPWSILFEVIIASTLLPTTENERVREWLRRMWGPQPPCPHSLSTTHTHKLYRSNHDCPYTLLCCPSVLWPLPKHWACHAYNPPSSGTLWERIPMHLVIPTSTSSYLSQQKTKIQTLTRQHFRRLCLFTPGHRSLISSLHLSPLSRFFPPFIKQRLANSKAHTSRFISANLPCNKFKNRLVNIMPFESTRVCLQPIRGVEGSDYINASCIDGYRSVKNSLSWIQWMSLKCWLWDLKDRAASFFILWFYLTVNIITQKDPRINNALISLSIFSNLLLKFSTPSHVVPTEHVNLEKWVTNMQFPFS